MSLAKVNLLGELSYFTLKRYIQSKPDNYQEAAQEYSAELSKLYQLSIKEQHQRLRARKLNVESETFVFEDTGTKLIGITIARSNLPCAKLDDRVVLIRQHEQEVEAPLVKGVIVGLSDQQIRIKFDVPLFEPVKEELNEEAKEEVKDGANPNESAQPVESSESHEAKSSEEENKEVSDPAADQDEKQEEEEEEKTKVEFRIRFDPEPANHRTAPSKDVTNFRLNPIRLNSNSVETTLANFAKLKCDQIIQRALLGFYDERNDTIRDKARVMSFTEIIPNLNNQQRAAIQQALMKRMTLIEGLAGTGKTVVAAHIAANVGRQGRGRVLVCSLIGETIDKLTEMISSVGGCLIVKLPDSSLHDGKKANGGNKAKSRKRDSYLKSETKQSNQCHLDKLVDDEIYLQAYSRFKQSLGGNHDKLHAHAFKMVNKCSESRRRELETKIISKADVVCCQLNELTHSLLRGIGFDMVIIDDVQVTNELDCLTAIMIKGIKQVVLLSDTRRDIRLARIPKRSQSMNQTSNGISNTRRGDSDADHSGPLRKKPNDTVRRSRPGSRLSENVVMHNRRSGPSRSRPSLEHGELFERLVSMGLPTVDMRVQYRCHATISNFFIHHFYASRLKDDPETNDQMSTEIVTGLKVQEDNFSWLPVKKYLTAVYKAPTDPKPSGSGDQLCKRSNDAIERTLKELVNRLSSERNVEAGDYRAGIIYNSRGAANDSRVRWARAKVGTVDQFIGQEEDFIILVATGSTERNSPEKAHIGTSSMIPIDFRRVDTVLNWVLTRARLGLFIVLEECVDDPENSDRGSCRSWRELIKYYAANDLIVEGFDNETRQE